MTVVLLILKIIGIILAALLGTVVLGILLVLFCPFRYRIWGSYHEKPDISIRVAWLMCIFQFRMDITDTQQMYLRIFGFRKNLSRVEKEAETDAFGEKTEKENDASGQFEDTEDAIETKSSGVSSKSPEKKISISQKAKRLWEKMKDICKDEKSSFEYQRNGCKNKKTVYGSAE